MTTYTVNPEKNGLELKFDTIPSATTRDMLKSRGWRWSRFGGFWYNRNTPENEQTARELAAGKAPTPAQPKNAPAAKKSAFTTDTPADRYARGVLGYIKLSSGQYIPLERHKIKTRLCFGYDELCADTVDRANKNANAATTDYTYFERLQCGEINRDIETIERAIKSRDEYDSGARCCFGVNDFVYIYPNTWRGDKLAEWRQFNPEHKPIDESASAADLRAILAGLNEQREHIKKASATYWKRYGGEKLRAWTYSMND
jgi:hypothetical protein